MKKKFVTVADLALKMDNLPENERLFMNNMAQMVCDIINKSYEGELTSEEVEEKFKGINEQLKSYDAEKFAQIVKDNEDLCNQVKSLGDVAYLPRQFAIINDSLVRFCNQRQLILSMGGGDHFAAQCLGDL